MTVGLAAATVTGLLNSLKPSGSGGAAYGPPAGTFLQLHTADPGAAGTTAISVGSTTRNTFTQTTSSGGSALALSTIAAHTNGGTSETISHFSVWTAASAGTFLYSIALGVPQAWASGNTFTATAVGVSLAPQAA
jgi:hypothetical protein